MHQYITGAVIRQLREQRGLTQAQLAEQLNVSDKTVSKWETGRGYPDVSLLTPIAAVFRVSVAELLSGSVAVNANTAANMRRSKFHVCPVCGNTIHSMGDAAISCHGILLPPLEAEPADAAHDLHVEIVEDEYFVSAAHEMTRAHYISFMAALSDDRLQFVRLYPEGGAETRFQMRGVREIYFCCNRDGLFVKKLP